MVYCVLGILHTMVYSVYRISHVGRWHMIKYTTQKNMSIDPERVLGHVDRFLPSQKITQSLQRAKDVCSHDLSSIYVTAPSPGTRSTLWARPVSMFQATCTYYVVPIKTITAPLTERQPCQYHQPVFQATLKVSKNHPFQSALEILSVNPLDSLQTCIQLDAPVAT